MNQVARRIAGSLKANGYTAQDACRTLHISLRTWRERTADPGSFRAEEIRRLRRLVDEDVCDAITK